MTLDNLHGQVAVLDIALPVDELHLAGCRLCGVLLAHDTLADGSHLRTVVRVDDGGDDVAAEGGTNLVEQVLVLLAALGVAVVADDQLRTIGRQTAVQRRRHARGEVAADARGAEEHNLGFLLLNQAAHDGRVGQRAERGQLLVVGHPYGVGAIAGQLLLHAGKILADNDRLELHAERRGQLAAFGQQFEAHVGDDAALGLDIYEYVVHLFFPD